jgi:hypothetical protein
MVVKSFHLRQRHLNLTLNGLCSPLERLILNPRDADFAQALLGRDECKSDLFQYASYLATHSQRRRVVIS